MSDSAVLAADAAWLKPDQQTQSILDLLPEELVCHDPDLRVLWANRSAAVSAGLAPEVLLGRHCYEVWHHRSEECPDCPVRKALQTGRPQEGEICTPDGQDLFIRAYPVQDEQGIVRGAIKFAVNITGRKRSEKELRDQLDRLEELLQARNAELSAANEQLQREIAARRRAEEALRSSEQWFHKVFHSSPDIMFIVDDEGRYFDVNENWSHLTGQRREEAIGSRAVQPVLIISPMALARIAGEIAAERTVHNLEINYRSQTGEQHAGLMSVELLDLSGDRCCLVSLRDITVRKHMEHEMARLDRLNLIGEMAAGIVHEIRNPLTAVRGFLQMFRERKEWSGYTKHLDLMTAELDRAGAIVTGFLSLAKNRPLNQKPHNLNTIILSLVPLIQADALTGDKQVQVKLSELPDLLLDENEIRQLILNLARNGLEAMTAPGMLTLSTFMDGGEVVLAVQDQGPGIEPGLVDKITRPFVTNKEQGTGLGLAVCDSIAAQHNATMTFETSPAGTTFYVRFPLSVNTSPKQRP
ncbi:MAG: PAS domain-containing protein [Bacillota bacterium]